MTLIELIVLSVGATLVGSILGAAFGAITDGIAVWAGRGALAGLALGMIGLPLCLVVLVNWNRYKAWRKRKHSPPHE